jgi:hypothetical protein
MGYHRDTFYEIRRAFQVNGMAGLIEERRQRAAHARDSASSQMNQFSGARQVLGA